MGDITDARPNGGEPRGAKTAGASKISPGQVVAVLLWLTVAGFLVESLRYQGAARTLPVIVALPSLLVASFVLIGEFRKATPPARQPAATPPRPGAPRAVAEPRPQRSTGRVLAWLLAYAAAITLGGFLFASALYALAFLLVEGRERWRAALLYAGVLSLLTWLLFVKLLAIPLYTGPLLSWILR